MLLLVIPALWFHLPIAPVILVAFLVGGLSAKYPASPSGRKSDPPRPQDVTRYKDWKAFVRGATPSKRWVAYRRPSTWMFLPVGVLLTINASSPWTLPVNIIACLPLVQGFASRQDSHKDPRHPYKGVSITAFWTKAPLWQRITCGAIAALAITMLIALWQLFYIKGTLAFAFSALAFLMSVWAFSRPIQSRPWRELIEWQSRLDSWIERDDGIRKAWGEAVVSSIARHGDPDNPLTCLYVEPKVSGGTASALKLGVAGIAPVINSDGYKEVRLLMALTKDKTSRSVDTSKLRIIVGKDNASLPDISTGKVSPSLAALMCDIAYADTATHWNKTAPLTHPVNVAADDEERNAWLITFIYPPSGNVPPLDIIGRDWLADENNPEVTLHMPVFPDITDQFHLAAEEDVRFNQKADKYTPERSITNERSFGTYIRLSHRFVEEKARWTAIVGKMPLPFPLYDTESRKTADEGWNATELSLVFTPPYTAADYARLDLTSFDPDAGYIGIKGEGARGTLVRVSRTAPERLDRIVGSKPIHRSYAQALVYPALLGVLPKGAEVHIDSCSQEGKDIAIWRINFSLGGGGTVADLRKRTANVQSAIGAATVIWDWKSAGEVGMWCMEEPAINVEDIPHWKRPTQQKLLINLVLSNAWGAVGMVNTSGQAPTVQRLSVMPHNHNVLDVRFHLPVGIGMGRIEAAQDKFLSAVNYGYGRILPQTSDTGANTWNMALSKSSPFPTMVRADWGVSKSCENRVFPLGVDDMGELVSWDIRNTYHIAVMGKSGTGKSSAAQIVVADAMLHGYQVIIIDPSKGAIDFTKWAKPRSLAFVETEQMLETEAAVKWLENEMRRRTGILSEYGVGNIADLEGKVPFDRILLVFDEFNSYLARIGKTASNPNHDMDIANDNAKINNLNNSITRTVSSLSQIALQGRTSGISILLGAQRLALKDLEKYKNGSQFYRTLGKMLLGNDKVDGIFSDSNIVAAHRMQASLKGDGGDIPKGRGIWEDMDGHLTSIQTWFSGGQNELADLVKDIPAPEPIDLTPFMPQEAEHLGEIKPETLQQKEEEVNEQVEDELLESAEEVDLGDWSI